MIQLYHSDDNVLTPISPLVCGGTFRSRGKKRKAKSKVIYRGQKERWIRRKFGANGVTLGADDEKKVKLEKGKRPTGVPSKSDSHCLRAYFHMD
jgi:hypothetical protein